MQLSHASNTNFRIALLIYLVEFTPLLFNNVVIKLSIVNHKAACRGVPQGHGVRPVALLEKDIFGGFIIAQPQTKSFTIKGELYK